ncbi:MAG: MFS transporter [Prevotellaceae bacterium]|jgi:maltose/moltooligosaccharide transporter|nr:MFS transporter [Prevotellaceae bacterium]
MAKKTRLSFWQIFNMSFGFLGIQCGFALQNANASRILQTFGADVEHLSWFWLVAPLTGMIIQPIIGYYSDRTWCKLGRRRPFFLAGAILTSIALILLPNAAMFATVIPAMFIGGGFLMITDASINVAMEPFRALVADNLPEEQRTIGFSVQTFLIGVGAVVGSWLPYMLSEWFGIAKVADDGGVPMNVKLSFYIGAATLIICVLWTIIHTKEYSPEELASFEEEGKKPLENEEKKEKKNGVVEIFRAFGCMPATMRQLGVVQFFSWIGLFGMWVFTTPAIAQHVYGVPAGDTSSALFNDAGNWVGILFGVYNAVAMVFALLLTPIANRIGRKFTHSIALTVGGVSLVGIYFIGSPTLLIIPMIGIGIAWASILAMPYAMLAGALPADKMGVYMGIFNFFITLPQIINGIIGGPMVKYLFGGQAIFALVFAGVCMLVAAFSATRVKVVG